jgi:hypothetical protein
MARVPNTLADHRRAHSKTNWFVIGLFIFRSYTLSGQGVN